MIGLADCNNFFVSCERTVDPSLEGRPVVVMSNNDGCIVARSNEAKAMGIKMGQPVFEVRDLVDKGLLTAISGHHLLYRDISLRVHDIFRRYAPRTLDYSVDEAFLDMSGIPDNLLMTIGNEICNACWKEVHIPVTIGFSLTKTLAKIITEVSKKRKVSVDILADREAAMAIMRSLPISELWGMGRRLSKRCYQSGIFTIADFATRDRNWVRKAMGVNGERSWLELNGVSCIDLSHVDRHLQDSISETRTFPEDVSDYDYIRARIAIYGADCAKKLRGMGGVCNTVAVFLRSNRFHTDRGIYCPETSLRLDPPTNDSTRIVSAAIIGLDRIFNPNAAFKRGGVLLTGISPAGAVGRSLFEEPQEEETQEPAKETARLMRVLDSLNREVGKPVVKLASQLTKGHPGHNDGYSSSFQAPSADP